MADLDKETAEEAYRAFEKEAEDIGAWTAEVDGVQPEKKEETPETTETTETTEDTPEEKKVESDIKGDTSKVGLINSKLTREQAKRLTVPDYDEFDDVVDGNGVRPERLAEYTSVIPFWYKSFKDGTEKMGTLPKYPRFLDRFGVTDATSISMTDVLKEFNPKLHDSLMDKDMEADRIARAGGEIIARRGLDFSRKLDDEDYAILERNGVKDCRKYRTVAEVTGISESVMDVDPDEGCVYNADYAEAMAGMCGDDAGAADVEVVSLDDVIGGLDPKFLKGFLGKNASEIKEVDNEIPEDEEAEPFMPFAGGKQAEPGSIFRSMQKASGEQKPDNPW